MGCRDNRFFEAWNIRACTFQIDSFNIQIAENRNVSSDKMEEMQRRLDEVEHKASQLLEVTLSEKGEIHDLERRLREENATRTTLENEVSVLRYPSSDAKAV